MMETTIWTTTVVTALANVSSFVYFAASRTAWTKMRPQYDIGSCYHGPPWFVNYLTPNWKADPAKIRVRLNVDLKASMAVMSIVPAAFEPIRTAGLTR